MPLAVTSDHQALADVARSYVTSVAPRAAARARLDAAADALPPFWAQLCELGWTGLHLPEKYGGSGAGLEELAIVLEALGGEVAPGPFLPTVLAGAVIDAAGDDAARAALLPDLASGAATAAVALTGSFTGSGTISGSSSGVLGAELASLLLLPVGEDLAVVSAADATVTSLAALDPALRLAHVVVDGATPQAMLPGGRALAVRIGRALAAAEASGGAAGVVAMTVDYAKVREQFGRTIGSFQAVKHHCANMLADSELATAVAWDAVRPAGSTAEAELTAATAASVALDAYRRCAELAIQVHGGIGFTWEHDAHLYLRRAMCLAAVFGGPDAAADEVYALSRDGVERELAVDLPPEAEAIRAETRRWVEAHRDLPPAELRAALAADGYVVPHWPKPFGRAATAVEQLVIDEEFAGVEVPNLSIGGWVTLTLLQHGTPEQIERWVGPSIAGDLVFCQLFSEPGAGSDAAAVSTRAAKVEGGWRLNGQKVWTSGAQNCNRGLATVRTDPAVKKHAGITAMVVDMHAPGVQIRPLREITGEAAFNEVFFDDVFIPDEDVVGEVNGGWTVARATLGNERVSIGGGKTSAGIVARDLLPLAGTDPAAQRAVGRLVALDQALRVLNVRQAARAVAGGPPGPEGNVSKLLGAEQQQHVAELGLALAGYDAATGADRTWADAYLRSRCLTIAGGTSEIVRNVIAERILGLPRDPLVR